MNAVDTFVIYDDVSYIKQGYINRNNILSVDKPQRITLELIGASSFKLINEIKVGTNSYKILKTIRHNYIKSPYYDSVLPLIETILSQEESNLAKYIGFSLHKISEYLQIDTELVYSSETEKGAGLKAEDRVIDICTRLKADTYINSIGGKKLYEKQRFIKKGIELKFLQTRINDYEQYSNEFVPSLSIIDVMMFNSKEKIQHMLYEYELL